MEMNVCNKMDRTSCNTQQSERTNALQGTLFSGENGTHLGLRGCITLAEVESMCESHNRAVVNFVIHFIMVMRKIGREREFPPLGVPEGGKHNAVAQWGVRGGDLLVYGGESEENGRRKNITRSLALGEPAAMIGIMLSLGNNGYVKSGRLCSAKG